MISIFPWRACAICFLFPLLSLLFTPPSLSAPAGNTPQQLEEGAAERAAGTAPLCRFGINATDDIANFAIEPLRAGWYVNYTASRSPAPPGSIEYMPVIHVHQTADATGYVYQPSGQELDQAIQDNLGAVWFIGNEPDRRDWAGGNQDEILPHLYAQVYHELYHHIKSIDPTARIFAGSIVQPTEVRLRYLDMVLDAYIRFYGTRMPVDGWSIHNFILNEASCEQYNGDFSICWGADIPPGIDDKDGLRIDAQQNDDIEIFKAQIRRFREWMAKWGYGDRPLYLSEYGVLMPAGQGFVPDFTPERVNQFMTETFDFLRTATDPVYGYAPDANRLVQRFSWYSTSDPSFNGQLFHEQSKARTAIGDHYAAYTANISEEIDFYPVAIYTEPGALITADGSPVSTTLSATIANSGNTQEAFDVLVRFYTGDPGAGGIEIGRDVVTLSGCGETATASVPWTDVPVGIHSVYVQTASLSSAAPAETQTDNNVRSQRIVVGTQGVYLPMSAKAVYPPMQAFTQR